METITSIMTPTQMRMRNAKELFNQAMEMAITSYAIGSPELILSSPRTHIYQVLRDRKCSINAEALGGINGMTDAIEWISSNSPVRSFFSTLMANFFAVWFDNDTNYREMCNQIGIATSLGSIASNVAQITQVAPIPEEIADRWLAAADIRDQLLANKWLFIYYLFFLWADIERLMQDDEPYQRILDKRVHTHRGPIAREAG